MKQNNALGKVSTFVYKYIWLLCALLFFLEIIFTTYTATILMKQSAQGMIESVRGEISGRVDGVLRLLEGIASDPYYSDLSIPMFERATAADAYRKSHDLYMVAFCDEQVNVISSDEKEPPAEPYSLAYRDYMQRLYKTGEYQITDAFVAGADNKTMNYTIAVPILQGEAVKGCVFGSIYFDDIEEIIERSTASKGHNFYLLGQESILMAGQGNYPLGSNFDEETKDAKLIGTTLAEINQKLAVGQGGNFWQLDKNGLHYVMYAAVSPTEWSLVYEVNFATIFVDLLPVLFLKCLLYFILCLGVTLLGKRYFKIHLAAFDHLLERMSSMQRELFQTENIEQVNYDNLLEMTKKGLVDQLTDLATRAVLFRKMNQEENKDKNYSVCFLDLDDLKRINDNFGHEAGDHSLVYFAKILKQYEQKYQGIAARYGGDEFILVLPEVTEKDALDIANQLCSNLRTSLKINEVSFAIHSSIGVAHCPRHGSTVEELISRADLALYAAKQKGKNCVCSYDDL